MTGKMHGRLPRHCSFVFLQRDPACISYCTYHLAEVCPSIALLPLLHVTKAQQILDYLATGTATIIGKLRTCAFSLDFNVRIFYIYFVPAAL